MFDKADLKELARALVNEMDNIHNADLAPKWEGGSIFIPKDSQVKDHEMPLDKLMHKIVMIRDNLRVLEQQINANNVLSDGEKTQIPELYN